MSNKKHRKRACCKIAFGKNSSNIRERCRIQSAALLVCAYRESENVDVILEKQLDSAEKVQNKPWKYSQRQTWNTFCFPASCRDFLRYTGLGDDRVPASSTGICGRNQIGEPHRMIHLRLAEKRGEAIGQGDGTGIQADVSAPLFADIPGYLSQRY